MTNRHTTRGIRKDNGEFVYGYYVEMMGGKYIFPVNMKVFNSGRKYTVASHSEPQVSSLLTIEGYLINECVTDVVKTKDYPLLALPEVVEITQEPDLFMKKIDDVDYYENDIINIEYLERSEDKDYDGRGIAKGFIITSSERLFTSLAENIRSELELIGNTHGIVDKQTQ